MKCPFCQEETSSLIVKCQKCGKDLSEYLNQRDMRFEKRGKKVKLNIPFVPSLLVGLIGFIISSIIGYEIIFGIPMGHRDPEYFVNGIIFHRVESSGVSYYDERYMVGSWDEVRQKIFITGLFGFFSITILTFGIIVGIRVLKKSHTEKQELNKASTDFKSD